MARLPYGVVTQAQLIEERRQVERMMQAQQRETLRKARKNIFRKKPITPRKAIGYLQQAVKTVPIQPKSSGVAQMRMVQPRSIIQRPLDPFEARDTRPPSRNFFEHYDENIEDDGDGYLLRFFDVNRKNRGSAMNTSSLFGF